MCQVYVQRAHTERNRFPLFAPSGIVLWMVDRMVLSAIGFDEWKLITKCDKLISLAQEKTALVQLMSDFVEAMNPGLELSR